MPRVLQTSTRPRRYGRAPYRTVLVHGGPGAHGSLAPVARELARTIGVVEPWQTVTSVSGEVDELADQIVRWAEPPVTLVGHSWGAWLSLLLAAERPELVRQLVLVACGPLTPRLASQVARLRRARLSPAQRSELEACERKLRDAMQPPSAELFRRLGSLAELADSFELLPHPRARNPGDPVVFQRVWAEAALLRRTGRLVRAVRRVRAPIVVIHGDSDPHPIRGVVEPLRREGREPSVVVLSRCGHEPWWERYARDRFFDELRSAVTWDR